MGAAEPLSGEKLFAWHRMLMKGRSDLKNIGRYRTDAAAMQIVSGVTGSPKVQFEAPRFVKWFNRSGPKGSDPLPA